MGRPRLSSPERHRRILASKANWRDANREYYRAQINQLSSRPEYKARRRELRARARAREEHAPEEDPPSLECIPRPPDTLTDDPPSRMHPQAL